MLANPSNRKPFENFTLWSQIIDLYSDALEQKLPQKLQVSITHLGLQLYPTMQHVDSDAPQH